LIKIKLLKCLWIVICGLIITGCGYEPGWYTAKDIVKITDFELSPGESKIAFSAITPIGNLDIWVVDLDGKNLKRLTFQDRSLTNRIAKVFKSLHWRNFFEIDMCYPGWTNNGRVAFCQKLAKTDAWSTRTVTMKYWTINSDGTDKKPQADSDKIAQRGRSAPVNRFRFSDRSEKYKVKILLKDDDLLILKDGEASLKRLIQ